MPPFQEGEDSLFFETFNRNKRSVSLDLRHPDARGVFEDLVRVSDVVYSNLRGDQPERLGLTYDELRHVNPRIVCCSLSGFGMTGPRAKEGGYDYMMQGLAGWMSLTGGPDGPADEERALARRPLRRVRVGDRRPRRALAGAPRRRRLRLRRLAVRDRAARAHATSAPGRRRAATSPPRRRNSAHPSIVPFQNFATADGWIVVACPKEKFWQLLCEAIGRPELAAEFPSFADRDRRRDELEPILEDVFRERTSEEWLAVLAAAGVPSAPVNDVEAALEEARLVEYEHPQLGTVRQVASPLRLSGRGAAGASRAGARRAHGAGAGRAVRLRAGAGAGARRPPASSETSERRLQMPRKAIQPEGMPTPKPPYSPVVVSGDTVYTAGQIATRRRTGTSSRAGSRSRPGRRSRTSARASRRRAARWTTSSR